MWVILGEQLVGYPPKGTQNFPLILRWRRSLCHPFSSKFWTCSFASVDSERRGPSQTEPQWIGRGRKDLEGRKTMEGWYFQSCQNPGSWIWVNNLCIYIYIFVFFSGSPTTMFFRVGLRTSISFGKVYHHQKGTIFFFKRVVTSRVYIYIYIFIKGSLLTFIVHYYSALAGPTWYQNWWEYVGSKYDLSGVNPIIYF